MPKAQVVEDAAQVAGQDAAEMPEDVTEQPEPIDPQNPPAWLGEWAFDFSGWTKMEDVMHWQDVVQANQFREVTAEMTKRVKRWPYAYDPSKVASYSEISPGQWRKAVEKAAVAAGAFFQNARD